MLPLRSGPFAPEGELVELVVRACTDEGVQQQTFTFNSSPLAEQLSEISGAFGLEYNEDEDFRVLIRLTPDALPLHSSEEVLALPPQSPLELRLGTDVVAAALARLTEAEEEGQALHPARYLLNLAQMNTWFAMEIIERDGLHQLFRTILLPGRGGTFAARGGTAAAEMAASCLCALSSACGDEATMWLSAHPSEVGVTLFARLLAVIFPPDSDEEAVAAPLHVPEPRASLAFCIFLLQAFPDCAVVAAEACANGASLRDLRMRGHLEPAYSRIFSAIHNTESVEFSHRAAVAFLCALAGASSENDAIRPQVRNALAAHTHEEELEELFGQHSRETHIVESLLMISMSTCADYAVSKDLNQVGLGKEVVQLRRKIQHMQETIDRLEMDVQQRHRQMCAMVPFMKVDSSLLVEQSLEPLVRHGWDSITWRNGYTLLHFAADGLDDPLLLELVASFSHDIEQVDGNGNRPIDYARKNECAEMESTLIRLRQQRRQDEQQFKAAVLVSPATPRLDEEQQLKIAILEKRLVNLEGLTPALREGLEAVIKFGWAGISWPSGTTAAHLAAQLGHAAALELLWEAGADMTAADEWQLTPLDYALQGGHQDIIPLLQRFVSEKPTLRKRRSTLGTVSQSSSSSEHSSPPPSPRSLSSGRVVRLLSGSASVSSSRPSSRRVSAIPSHVSTVSLVRNLSAEALEGEPGTGATWADDDFGLSEEQMDELKRRCDNSSFSFSNDEPRGSFIEFRRLTGDSAMWSRSRASSVADSDYGLSELQMRRLTDKHWSEEEISEPSAVVLQASGNRLYQRRQGTFGLPNLGDTGLGSSVDEPVMSRDGDAAADVALRRMSSSSITSAQGAPPSALRERSTSTPGKHVKFVSKGLNHAAATETGSASDIDADPLAPDNCASTRSSILPRTSDGELVEVTKIDSLQYKFREEIDEAEEELETHVNLQLQLEEALEVLFGELPEPSASSPLAGMDLHCMRACKLVMLNGWKNVKWASNFTGLHLAACRNSASAVNFLLEARGNPGLAVMDKSGRRPLDYAQKQGFSEDFVAMLDPERKGYRLIDALSQREAPSSRGVEETPADADELRLRLQRVERERAALLEERNRIVTAGVKAGALLRNCPMDEAMLKGFLEQLQAFGSDNVREKLQEAPVSGGLALDAEEATGLVKQLEMVLHVSHTMQLDMPPARATSGRRRGRTATWSGPNLESENIHNETFSNRGSLSEKPKEISVRTTGEAKADDQPKAEAANAPTPPRISFAPPPDDSQSQEPQKKTEEQDMLKSVTDVGPSIQKSQSDKENEEISMGQTATEMPSKGKGKAPRPAPKGKGPKGGGKKGDGAKAGGGPTKPSVKPNVQMKPLWWLRYLKGVHLKEGETVWDTVEYDANIISPATLEERFCKQGTATKKTKVNATAINVEQTAPKLIRIITDPQLIAGREAALRHLPTAQEVATAIRELDDQILDADNLQRVLANVCPDAVQAEQLRAAREANPILPLAIPEQYMWVIMQIPAYKPRLDSWSFVRNYSERRLQCSEALKYFEEVASCMLNSSTLPTLLGIILGIGNYLNGGTDRGQADGFDIETLTKLESVKDADGRDLRHVVFEILFTEYPAKAANLADDLAPLLGNVTRTIGRDENAAEKLYKKVRVAIEDYEQLVSALEDDLSASCASVEMIFSYTTDPTDQFKLKMPEQMARAKDTIAKLVDQRKRARSKFEQLLRWFKIANMKSDSFFLLWDEFFVPASLIMAKPAKGKTNLSTSFCGTGRIITCEQLAALWGQEAPDVNVVRPKLLMRSPGSGLARGGTSDLSRGPRMERRGSLAGRRQSLLQSAPSSMGFQLPISCLMSLQSTGSLQSSDVNEK